LSYAQLYDIPAGMNLLLVGYPGAGKSTFCQQAVLNSLSVSRPTMFVVTEFGSIEAMNILKERGSGEIESGLLYFVDAFNEEIELPGSEKSNIICADCNNLSSIDIAVSKLSEKIGKTNILLVFDSLTSPYLFSGSEILRFMRQTLSRFAARGNAVLSCLDEGCGKSEDLIAMMSLSNAVIKIRTEKDHYILDVVKYPKKIPKRLEIPVPLIDYEESAIDNYALRNFILSTIRGEELNFQNCNLSIEDAQRLLAYDNLHNLNLFNELVELEKDKFSQMIVHSLEEYIRQNRSIDSTYQK
jgi:KaiC/GvpD/RAD55 family RecA-like ATPase